VLYGWDHLGIYNALVASGSPVNLMKLWAPSAALLGTIAMLLVWFFFSHWWENRFRYGSGLKRQDTKKLTHRTKEA